MTRNQLKALQRFLLGSEGLGHQNALYQQQTPYMAAVIRECPNTLAEAQQWNVPGLFVSNDEIENCLRDYLSVTYVMKCGVILYIIIPADRLRLAKMHTVVNRGLFFNQLGFRIALDEWKVLGHMQDIVYRRGRKREWHFAKKPAVIVE